ncbi:MAG: histidine phosphatase family protein [Candidatus Thorarchaeota archaeon]
MTGLLHLMRHAETAIDHSVPVHEWQLTEEGLRHVENLASMGIFDSIDSIISSTEPKALQTAMPFADRLGIGVERYPELRELDRGKGGLLSNAEYLHSVEGLLNRHHAVPGWEFRDTAMARFQTGLRKIMDKGGFKEALLISHGIVLSMHFASLLGFEEVFSRWQRLRFCAWGTIQGTTVIKDII